MKLPSPFLLCAAILLPPAAAQPYFFDDFEIYSGGSVLDPSINPPPSNGGWGSWDNVPAYAATVRDGAVLTTGPGGGPVSAFSGTKFLEINNQDDAIQPFILNAGSGIGYINYTPSPPASYPLGNSPSGGVWRLESWIYVPQSAPTGTATMYWIGNNSYQHASPGVQSWILQTRMDFSPAGVLINDDIAPYTNGSRTVPFDVWFQLRADFDLTNNCKTLWIYDPSTMTQPAVMASSPVIVPGWTALSTMAFANLDLFTLGGTYYADDVRLARIAPDGASLYQVNHPNASLACNNVQGTACLPAVTSVFVGGSGTFTWSSPLVMPYDTAVVLEPAIPNALTTPGNQVVNLNLLSPALLWVNTLSPVPSLVGFPAPSFSFPFSPALPGITLTGQMIIIDATHPDSFRLSQPATLIVP